MDGAALVDARLLMPARFAGQVALRPDAPALAGTREPLTYGDLELSVADLAAGLRAQGVEPGDLVAVSLSRSASVPAILLAVWRLGAAWVPLDPGWPESRRAAVLKQVAPRILVSDREITEETGCNTVLLSDLRGTAAPLAEAGISAPDDLAYVLFTSGSTGEPRGVRISHANLAGLFTGISRQWAVETSERWLWSHSLAFGFAQWEIWGALSTGGCLVVADEAAMREPQLLANLMLKEAVSVCSRTPSGFRQLHAGGFWSEILAGGHLRELVLSGEPLRAADRETWLSLAGSESVRCVSQYGLTETAGRVGLLNLRDSESDEPLLGEPADDCQWFVIDAEAKVCAPGDEGELCIAGAGISSGYWGEGDDDGRFITLADETGKSRRVFRTGDRVRQNDKGQWLFAGRTDQQLKLRGYRIEPADIETALLAHPGVGDAAVLVDDSGPEPVLRAWVSAPASAGPEFWPSLGEYQVYDEDLYGLMNADEYRVDAYRRALEACAADRVVLDIGTGQDALLARLAASAGARHVYAVEVLPDAAEAAAKLVAEQGLSDRITVLSGDMLSVSLPEPVEVVTQGIVGNIGSSDGIAGIWNSALPAFADGFTAVPGRCLTWAAPVELPGELFEAPAYPPLAAEYVRAVYEDQGREFDIRLCVRGLPDDAQLADPGLVEELDFHAELATDEEQVLSYTVTRSGRLDGLLLWTELELGAERIDFLSHQQAWLPVFLPLTDDGCEVAVGDVLELRWRRATPAGDIFPDYAATVTVRRPAGEVVLEARSRHHEQSVGASRYHRELQASVHKASQDDLAAWCAARLPEWMRPASIERLSRLPRTTSDKLDRQALLGRQQSAGRAPAPGLESDIAGIWARILERDDIHADDNFFELGGDSILAVRLTTELQRLLNATVFLVTLFDAPRLADLAALLTERHPDAVAERYAPAAELETGEL